VVTDGLPTRSGTVFVGPLGARPQWQTGQVGGRTGAVAPDVEGPIFTPELRELAGRIVARYPWKRSALVPLLYLVQSEVGWVPRQGMREVGEVLDLTTAEVEAVATFYTMVKLHPCGRYVISVCTNPSCSLLGGRRLLERARELLGSEADHVTEDGMFTVEEEECLAACDKAPVATLNYVYFDRVTEEALEAMIRSIREGRIPEAARGGVPGDLKEVSRILAGVGPRPDRAPGAAASPDG
jgi:NADH-quinone oxidoreductase subunit E